MKYRYLGKSGLLVSRVCLGTLSFGFKNWGTDAQLSARIISAYLDGGGNFIDTANIYGGGLSEGIIGDALKERQRDKIILATKCFFRTGPEPNTKGLSRKNILEACEASLKALKTDYIDLFYCHSPDPHTSYEETMRAFNDLVRQGKVRYLGCSNLPSWQIVKANAVSARLNLEPFACGQYMYNLINRDIEREILPALQDQGMGLICWSPLAGGMLSGKYVGQDQPAEGSRFSFRTHVDIPRFWSERGKRIAEAILPIAKQAGEPAWKLALAWPLRDKRVAAVAAGATNEEQVRNNLLLGDWDLPDCLWQELNKIAFYEPDYLTSFISENYRGILEDVEV
jgi:aryl-alcohol dehydrogenase-like predicted oxidoreductase